MRLLVITDGVPPEHRGGVASSVLVEVDELVRRGHDVTVLSRRHDPALPLVEQRAGWRLLRHPAPARGSRGYYAHPLVTTALLPGWLRSLHRREGFDALYVHSTFHGAAAVRAGLGDRTVYRFHAPSSEEVRLDARGGKYPFARTAAGAVADLTRRAELGALRGSARVLTTSAFVTGQLHAVHPALERPVDVVPLAVDLRRFSVPDDAARRAARAAFGVPDRGPVLVTARRLVRRMGLEHLVDAVGLLRAEHPGLVLLLAGRGYLADALARQVHDAGLGDAVRLLGFVPDDDLPRLHAAADLFVLPTADLEGFGVVTLEAFATGVPVVATPVGANPEVAGALGAEFLAPGTGAADLAEGVRSGLAAPAGSGGRARRLVEERFSPRAVGGEVEAALRSVARG